MAELKEVVVPDIGNFDAVEIIELAVAVGDAVDAEQTLITLESDKASMDIPAPYAGVVKSFNVKVGDKVATGDVILQMEMNGESVAEVASAEEKTVAPEASHELCEIHVPDIGGAKEVTVIEINASVGSAIAAEETILTLESEKASMEMPCPATGILREIKVKEGDQVSEGSLVAILEAVARTQPAKEPDAKAAPTPAPQSPTTTTPPAPSATERPAPVPPVRGADTHSIHATPAVRRLAREFGVDLALVAGSGRKSRILPTDVQNYVKQRLAGQSSGSTGLPEMPAVDFTQFGEVEYQDLARIKKLSAQNLHRNWVVIPHVTQFDEVDITEMEAFRQANKGQAEQAGFKLTPLVFLMKAAAKALRQFPSFNSSLAANGQQLILKKYVHVGVAVDTPGGLVVPVVRDVDIKGLFDLAEELGQISAKARNLKLTANDMQGACFTISSLGGIGGTAFTPIINAPDVAILGVSKSQTKPIYDGANFVPRLMLPLSLSYDHRVIDGAEAARFVTYLGSLLTDIRRLLL